MNAKHENKVERIAGKLRQRLSNAPVRIESRYISHQAPIYGGRHRKAGVLDAGELDSIISIDALKRICVAEPGVTFEELVTATLPLGLAPRGVPELRTTTIGGAVSGSSDATSVRVGGFHDTCVAYEVITANGEVLDCRPDNVNALIFERMHGSFGTLGLLSKLTFELMPAKPFVHVRYEHYTTPEAYKQAIMQHTLNDDIELMDGIMHAPGDYVLSVGDFVDEAPYATRYDQTKVYSKSTAERTDDYLRTADYFFRYDPGVTNVVR